MSSKDKLLMLIVDDEDAVRRLLRRFFEGEDFDVDEARDGDELRAKVATRRFDVILLDVHLGRETGFDLIRDLKLDAQTPVLFISGKDDVVDRVVGLELGAEDYITKPFELREVLARVRVALRRRRGGAPAAPAAAAPREVVRFDGWRLDRARRSLTDPTGRPVQLTTGEFDLLAIFASHPNRPLTRNLLMDELKGADWAPFDRAIDTQVGRLRRKIEDDPSNPKLIKSVRGVGYMFAATLDAG